MLETGPGGTPPRALAVFWKPVRQDAFSTNPGRNYESGRYEYASLLGPFGPPGGDGYPTDKQLEGYSRTCSYGLQASILDHGQNERILRDFCEWRVYPLRPTGGLGSSRWWGSGEVAGIVRRAISSILSRNSSSRFRGVWPRSPLPSREALVSSNLAPFGSGYTRAATSSSNRKRRVLRTARTSSPSAFARLQRGSPSTARRTVGSRRLGSMG